MFDMMGGMGTKRRYTMANAVHPTISLDTVKVGRGADERKGHDANETSVRFAIRFSGVAGGFDKRHPKGLPEGVGYADSLVAHVLPRAGALLSRHHHIDGVVVGICVVSSSMTQSYIGGHLLVAGDDDDSYRNGADLLRRETNARGEQRQKRQLHAI